MKLIVVSRNKFLFSGKINSYFINGNAENFILLQFPVELEEAKSCNTYICIK